MIESTEVWEKERVFVRGLASSQYSISEYRKWMKTHPRVRRWEDVRWSGGPHLFHKMQVITPQTMPIQSVFMHLEELAPGAAGMNHGHQNEALLYILEGRGHDIHDGKRYDWKAGDVMVVHNGCVHQHFNDDPERPARILIIKSKPLFNFLNLVEQGRVSDEIPGTTLTHQPSEEFAPPETELDGARGS
ncbi:MAG TPA: cupin domain-containing protein [Chloroflexota bacterium]|nr:cupin domain-containing protein [Chloroflexota bacterium]